MNNYLSSSLGNKNNSREDNKSIHSEKVSEDNCMENDKSNENIPNDLVLKECMEKSFISSAEVNENRVRSDMTTLQNPKRIIDSTWDYAGEGAKISIHGIHTYPAMMIPQITKRLIEEYGTNSKTNLDPFCGSGTSLVESLLHNMNAYGVDINPLAIILSKVKTTPINHNLLMKEERKIIDKLRWKIDDLSKIELPNYHNIDYWFKPKVIRNLAYIKENLKSIDNEEIRNFFLVCFSETVRKVSNTRGGEYKLYRIPKDKLAEWNPDTFTTFLSIVHNNIKLMQEYYSTINHLKMENKELWAKVLMEDMTKRTSIPEDSIELIVTSPPYGDSRTTVAYGQFSRLALQWLDYDYEIIKTIDKMCLGGIPPKKIKENVPSNALYDILEKITAKDGKRVLDVYSFFNDFNKTVDEIDRVTKEGACVCMVVGNRTVKEEVIPTDVIIAQLFIHRGYTHLQTMVRAIPTKRLPKRTSPSNIAGKSVSTMNEEFILILQK